MILFLMLVSITFTAMLFRVIDCPACSKRAEYIWYALTGMAWGFTIGWCLI